MARRRKTVRNLIAKKRKQIKKLENELIALRIEEVQISDKFQQYSEEIVERVISKRPKKTEEVLIGKVAYIEHFIDEDTGEAVPIQRHRKVREGNEWYPTEFEN